MPEWFEKVTIGEQLDRTAARYGEREALAFQEQRWTFQQLKADTDRAARGLIQYGVQPGDKVALWLTNLLEWLHIQYAVAKIGAVLVPINTRFRTADLQYVLRNPIARRWLPRITPAPSDTSIWCANSYRNWKPAPMPTPCAPMPFPNCGGL